MLIYGMTVVEDWNAVTHHLLETIMTHCQKTKGYRNVSVILHPAMHLVILCSNIYLRMQHQRRQLVIVLPHLQVSGHNVNNIICHDTITGCHVISMCYMD